MSKVSTAILTKCSHKLLYTESAGSLGTIKRPKLHEVYSNVSVHRRSLYCCDQDLQKNLRREQNILERDVKQQKKTGASHP